MPEIRPASRPVAIARMLVGAAVIGILIYTYAIGIPAQGANPFDYFGYFTNLTSLLTGLILIASGAAAAVTRTVPDWMPQARGAAVTGMIIVALIYNLIVPGTGTAPAWVSITLHLVFPVLLVLDWLLVGDRPPLPWRRLWIVLPYPLTWLVVTLVRGATDGWVPYGFLLPERGAAQLAATAGGLLLALLAAAALVWTMSRQRGVATVSTGFAG
ncbi:Pr6Pr family membrane protein [Microbacterium sp. OVT16B]|uniref:Pr6Pr family membrane protein n=1 Tax=Microbacterium sp. OVT16B TaxID=2862682 RepID=UPI001CBD10F0|nr:Pr6Pr family membrane protein [Microbacterium sp. OVT16B]